MDEAGASPARRSGDQYHRRVKVERERDRLIFAHAAIADVAAVHKAAVLAHRADAVLQRGDRRAVGFFRGRVGLGFERMVMYLTGIGNIRDVELHPRTVGNADF